MARAAWSRATAAFTVPVAAAPRTSEAAVLRKGFYRAGEVNYAWRAMLDAANSVRGLPDPIVSEKSRLEVGKMDAATIDNANRWRLETPGHIGWARTARPDDSGRYLMISSDC